jgi:hypothetical protein
LEELPDLLTGSTELGTSGEPATDGARAVTIAIVDETPITAESVQQNDTVEQVSGVSSVTNPLDNTAVVSPLPTQTVPLAPQVSASSPAIVWAKSDWTKMSLGAVHTLYKTHCGIVASELRRLGNPGSAELKVLYGFPGGVRMPSYLYTELAGKIFKKYRSSITRDARFDLLGSNLREAIAGRREAMRQHQEEDEQSHKGHQLFLDTLINTKRILMGDQVLF